MESQFQQHQRPNRSHLEQWRDEISEMRSLNWPFMKIAKWLLENQNFQISAQAIHQFCKRREIPEKRTVLVAKPKPQKTIRRSASKQKKIFEYDGSHPIERWPKPTSSDPEK